MNQPFKTILLGAALCVSTLSFWACGTAGVPSDQLSGGNVGQIRGSIVGSTGSQQDMFGYIMVLVERDTGISRVAPINEGGIFVFGNVKADMPQTLILLNSSYKISAVLSITGKVASTIRQYFVPQSSFLPRLINKGPIMRFENERGLSITNDTAADADNDGIPAGVDPNEGGGISLALKNQLKLISKPDSDGDGLVNEIDFDLDGDGIINWFDTDMDNNPPIDVFDADADDDIFVDEIDDETLKNRYTEGVEFFGVTVEQGPNETNVIETKIILQTQVREPVKKVWIDTANSLIGSACYNARRVSTVTPTDTETDTETDTDTETQTETVSCVKFDKQLKDDGQSNDQNANDGYYGQAIILGKNVKPLGNQAIFLKLDYGNEYFKWYPYVFSNVTLGNFNILYNANGYSFSRVQGSAPFGTAFTSYKWEVKIYDSNDEVKWSSGPLEASKPSVAVKSDEIQQIINAAAGDPENGVKATTLKAVGFAYSLQKIPGIPAYVVKSRPVQITN